MAKNKPKESPRIQNRKARHDYHLLEKFESGIVLTGTEVKSLRNGAASIAEAFVRINDGEATLYDANIDRYPEAADNNHEPKRKRRLLLHRREIRKLEGQVKQSGITLIPLTIYFNARGLAKVELALATGKKQHDKRQDLKKREHKREMDRATSRRR